MGVCELGVYRPENQEGDQNTPAAPMFNRFQSEYQRFPSDGLGERGLQESRKLDFSALIDPSQVIRLCSMT